jgi:hypothetical protein
MHIPVLGGGSTSYLNAGGVGHRNSVQLRTAVNYVDTDINTSEIALEAGNGGFSAQVYGHWTGGADGAGGPTLVYAGVENVSGANGPGFAGMVAIDPGVTSQYAVVLDGSNNITIGATGGSGVTTEYTAAVGVLNKNTLNMTGLAITPDKLVLNNSDNAWVFGPTGILNFPNNNGQIGALEAPYTGLEFRTGSGADWIGISYGEINDNNTSYFYFDKDGSNYLTANHRAHLQLKNPAHNGHVEWLFDSSGNLTLPAGGDILNSTGHSVLGGGGGNGTANRVQFAHAGNIDQNEDSVETGRYNIVVNAEYDVVIQTNESEQEFRFTADGALKLPQGSTISDQDLSVDITVDRPSESAYWYNLFGDTGATTYANATINGSVVHDAGGNVYVLGSTLGNNFDSNSNLFLKYSPEGRLLWRRTWTDNNGLSCGSYNASLRYIEANVVLGTQDTILWAAQTPNQNISYVGTMDTEGNMVDQFGNVRLPVRLDNFAVTDLEPADTIGAPFVLVVGQLHVNGAGPIPERNYPTFAGIDLDTAELVDDVTVVPAGTDLTAGMFSGPPWANSFKAIAVLPPVGEAPPIVAVVGSYYDGSHTHAMVTLTAGPETLTVGIGVDNHGGDNVIGEDVCCDANGNVYVIVNNISSNYAVVLCGTAGSIESSSAVWQHRFGSVDPLDNFYATAVTYDNGYVYVLGQFYQHNIDDVDVMLIKLNKYTGNIVWTRRIRSPGDDGLNFVGPPGWESSSGIHVQDGLIVISFATQA